MALSDKIKQAGYSLKAVADAAGVRVQDVSHFLHQQNHKIGKSARKKIRLWMMDNGFLKKPAPREMCLCPDCQAIHPKKRNWTKTVLRSEDIQNHV